MNNFKVYKILNSYPRHAQAPVMASYSENSPTKTMYIDACSKYSSYSAQARQNKSLKI